MNRFVLLLVLALASVSVGAQTDSVAQQKIADSVNHERTSRGLQPLTLNSQLTSAAQAHSRVMASHHAIAHDFPGETETTARIVGTGLHVQSTGENVASSGSAERAHDALMHSPKHRDNILNPKFNSVGIGVIRNGDVLYITEDFARVIPGYSAAEAEQRIANYIDALRRNAKAKQLPLVANSALRKLTCDMASEDFLSMANVRTLPGVSTTVVFTTADLSQYPEALDPLKKASGSSMSVGVCYASSASHAIPTYWAAVVTYF